MSNSSVAATQPAPSSKRVFVADIECLLCARAIGAVIADRWPPTEPVQFQPAGAQTSTTMRDWWRLRCPACGGNTVAADIATRRVRQERRIDWESDHPRRGRPPKWLVEHRCAELAATPGTLASD